MSYVDSFVIPVPKKNLKTYRRMSRTVGKVWRDHGAVSYTDEAASTATTYSTRASRAARSFASRSPTFEPSPR